MTGYRGGLPQLSGQIFLADAGIETDLIFNHGIDIPHFAAHLLLENARGRKALDDYFRAFLELAQDVGTGFILDSQTWKAHPHWAAELGATTMELRDANRQSIAFISGLRKQFSSSCQAIVLNGIIGPCGDAYAPGSTLSVEDAEAYHSTQIGWLADTEADMVTATTFTQANEAIGFVRAAQKVGLPAVVSFTVETDSRLPGGQSLDDAILAVDAATQSGAAYFMVNCAHHDHFFHTLEGSAAARRIRGIRCNASRRSHAELDQSTQLDDGDPVELGSQYKTLIQTMPWLNVFGGCCGSDLRHVTEIARALTA
jgi:S-methylmethionine-dependent homocysteine/selenocysteine methylase